MSDTARDKAARLLKKGTGSVVSSGSNEHAYRPHKKAGSVSTLSFADEHGHESPLRHGVRLENTYQLGPSRTFPSGEVRRIIENVLESYLAEEQYQPELCRQMTKTLSEVVRARVKELMIPRFKIICLVHIGQLGNQGIRVGSRCLWEPACDTYSTCEFKNRSLFAICTVYAIYSE